MPDKDTKTIEVDEKVLALVNAAALPLADADEAKLLEAVGAMPEAHRAGAALMGRLLHRMRDGLVEGRFEAIANAAGFALPKAPDIKPEPKTEPKPEPEKVPTEPVVRSDGTLDLSAVPADRRDVVREVWGAKLEARKAHEMVRAQAVEMRRRDLVAEAKEKLAHLPNLDAEKTGALLLRASEALDAPSYAMLFSSLEAASAQLKQSALIRSLGREGTGDVSGAQAALDAFVDKFATDRKLDVARATIDASHDPTYVKLYAAIEAERSR